MVDMCVMTPPLGSMGRETGVGERVVEDVQRPLAGGFEREAVAGADVLDEDEEPIVFAVPEERDLDVFVSALGQLGHLRPPWVVMRGGSSIGSRRTIEAAGLCW